MVGLEIRGYRPADISLLVELINESDQVDCAGLGTSEDELVAEMDESLESPERVVWLAEASGEMCGYVRLRVRDNGSRRQFVCVGIVHPRYRRQGIGRLLMEKALVGARLLMTPGPNQFRLLARQSLPGINALATSAGLRAAGGYSVLRLAHLDQIPPARCPSGYTLLPYRVGEDERRWVEAHNTAFADADNLVVWQVGSEWRYSHSRRFVPEDHLSLVEADGGRLVGLCRMERSDGEPQAHGLVDCLAVIPGQRRRGLGTTLLAAGLQRLREAGCQEARLVVSDGNRYGARKLYEQMGFVPWRRTIVYARDL